MTEIVYRGHDNKASVIVSQDGQPMDFDAVERMTLALRGHDGLIDSDNDADAIDWSEGGGKIVFALGPFDIKPGTYDATLVAYDPAHPAGQVIAHPSGVQLTFRVIA